MSGYQMQALGWVRGGRSEVEDDAWGSVVSRIELDRDQFGPEAFAGLDACSHVEVLFVFDQMRGDYIAKWAEHFGTDGFERIKKEGVWYSAVEIPYACTSTGPGHVFRCASD